MNAGKALSTFNLPSSKVLTGNSFHSMHGLKKPTQWKQGGIIGIREQNKGGRLLIWFKKPRNFYEPLIWFKLYKLTFCFMLHYVLAHVSVNH